MPTLTQSIAKNAVFQMTGKILSVVLGAAAFGFMARYLGKSGFGEYTTITTFSVFFSTMADMGFYFIAVREISKPGAEAERLFGNAFTLRLLATVVFVSLSPIVAMLFFHYSPMIQLGIVIAGFSTFFVSINQILVAIFQKHLRTGRVAVAEVVGRVLFLAMIFFLIRWNMGIMAFLWALGISSLVNFLILYVSSRKFLKFRPQFNWAVSKRILLESWPIGLVTIMNLFYYRFDAIQLSVMKPAEDVGIYGAAYKIIDILIALPAIFVGLVVPILSRYYTENREKFNEVFRQSFNVLFLVSVPIAIGTQFVASWIIVLVGGPKFADSAPVLQILIIAVLGMFISTLATNTIVVINKQRSIIWTSLYAALSSIILNFILIPHLTYIGASLTTVITEFSIAVMTYTIVYRSIRLRPELIVPLKAILAGAVMWITLYFLASDSPLLNVLVGGVVYVGMIFVLRAIRIHEVKKLIKISEQPHV